MGDRWEKKRGTNDIGGKSSGLPSVGSHFISDILKNTLIAELI